MNIDWITVLIQAVNFLILIWILKRFLYKPILNAMDARQKAVFAKLREAEKREEDAELSRKNFEDEKQRVKDESRKVIREAHEQADSEKDEMVKEAHQDMIRKQSKFDEQINLEKKSLYQAVRNLAGDTLVKTARDAMQELATKELEVEMISLFVQKLESTKSADLDYIVKGIQAGQSVYVSTSQEADSKAQKLIEDVLKKQAGTKPNLIFKVNPDLICGVEVLCDTVMIRWGFDKYIENFGRSLNDALNKITG
ncbi:MAG: hypothetical protein JXR30_01805 [Alphaproteobacteria bacterium]|nr:hypothetical protein [Alphaproteobacteria bacterium]